MAEMKRAIKDSVFSCLFQQPEYVLELYKTLHPEDQDVTEKDLKLITIKNVLSNGIYNDLGLLIRDVLIVLMEAQSTFSFNVVLRIFLYLAETYKEYADAHEWNLYSGTPVRLPRPELYVVYTGDRLDVPDIIHLSDLYEGWGDAEVTIHVIRASGNGSIVDQYIRFCKIADEERKDKGYTMEAVRAAIRRCLEENVLAPFLREQQREVQNIMFSLFDQERITELHELEIARKNHAEGKAETKMEIARNLISFKMPFDQIAAATGLSVAEVEQLIV